MLTALVFTPLVGALVILFMNKEKEQQIRRTALAFSLIPLLIVLLMPFQFEPAARMQFVQRPEWIPSVGVSYYLGTDGISFPPRGRTALVTPLAMLAAFSIPHRVQEFFALFLLLETGMLGVFVALDYFLFYIVWEVVLVP